MDFSYLISISDGDKEFIREFVSTFESNSAAILTKMRKAMAESDLDAIRRLAHQIKPSFEMLNMESHALSVKTQADPQTLKPNHLDFMESECQEAVESMRKSFTV